MHTQTVVHGVENAIPIAVAHRVVFIGPHVCFTNDLYPRAVNDDFELVETRVEDGASIGANSTIRCGVAIGKNSMVGAGSVVTKDVPPHALFFGNPAKPMGYVCVCGRKLNKTNECELCGFKLETR